MTAYLGDFKAGQTVHFMWSTNAAAGGSITRSTNGEVRVYKDNGVTQSVVGVTDTEDFDSLTGVHACTIVTTDAFYAAGSNFTVVLQGATIDGVAGINAVLAHFSIQNRSGDAMLDAANGVETGLTVRQALRLFAAAAAAKLSGAGTSTVTIRNAVADNKNRIVATVDSSGNRSAITYDLT